MAVVVVLPIFLVMVVPVLTAEIQRLPVVVVAVLAVPHRMVAVLGYLVLVDSILVRVQRGALLCPLAVLWVSFQLILLEQVAVVVFTSPALMAVAVAVLLLAVIPVGARVMAALKLPAQVWSLWSGKNENSTNSKQRSRRDSCTYFGLYT
jgi:hypothetical protein